MEYNGIERRACIRFKIPGSTVSYKKSPLLSDKEEYGEEFCPILDISRGGVRFLSQKPLKINTQLTLKISVPGETIPLKQLGIVRWSTYNPGKSYKYQIGVQFNPYGEKKEENYPGNLVKIIAFEQKFALPNQLETDEFETDSS